MLNCIAVFFQQVCLSIESGVWTIWIVTGCFESIGHDLFLLWGVQQSCWIHGPVGEFIFLCFWRSQVFGTVFTCEVAWLMGGCIKINEDPCHDSSFIWILSPKYNQKRVFILLFFPLRRDFVSRNGLLVGILPLFWCFPSRVWSSEKRSPLCLQLKQKYSHLMAFSLVGAFR